MCNYPLHAIRYKNWLNPETGKNVVKVISQDDFWNLMIHGWKETKMAELIELPCGRCIECRLAYSRMWADRLMCEAEAYPDELKWFITLTYEDMYLPISTTCDDDGEIHEIPTLVRKDIVNFVKRLRKNLWTLYREDAPHLKYYYCGEYGSHGARPHFHIIVFGLPLTDLQPIELTRSGFPQWQSDFIDKAWQYKGRATVSNVNWDTCAYVARYVLKKPHGDARQVYEKYQITPEFVGMSRRPAIAREWYEAHKDKLYEFDSLWISTPDGGRPIRSNRYFDSLYDMDPKCSVRLKRLKEKRATYRKQSEVNKLRQTSMEKFAFLESQEQAKKSVVSNSLKRRL